ncbi:MAG: hypothetical protein ACI4TA_03650 [Acetatifactor sp.]
MDIKEVLFYDLEELFGEGIELTERTTEYGNICDIPSALHSFYKKYSFAKMPFGSIFTVEEARKMSYQQPFMDEEWFCFGQDNYGFVFWLCKEVDGRTFFNAWDHDMSDDIDEGMEITLEEFLQDIINDFEENETCSIEIKSCEEDALAELVKIKKAFNMTESISELQEIKRNLPYEISDDFSYMKALKILKDLNLNKVKIDIFHID